MLRVTNAIRDAVRPDLTMFLDCRCETMEGKPVICVRVQRGTARPYYLHSKGIRPEGVFVRQGASTVPASEAAILDMIKETSGDSYEAARSLGLSQWQAMKLVVLPQAVKNVLPALANEVITMVKESSICSTYSMMELMWAAKNVAGTTGISVGPYVLVAAIYFCINFPASKAIEAIERRMRRGDKR